MKAGKQVQKTIIKAIIPILLFTLLVGCDLNEADDTFDTPMGAIQNYLSYFMVPEEYRNALVGSVRHDKYFNQIYESMVFDGFALTMITTNDNKVSIFCTPKGSDGKYSCRGLGTVRYTFPVKEEIADRFIHYQQDDGNWCIYGLHRKIDTPVYINGIAATTTDYTVELGGQTQELQFSYVLLDESAVDEGVDITY